jgi:hypothetical protein
VEFEEIVMRDSDPCMIPPGRKVNFLDASEEEILDLVRSLLSQLTIMSSCLTMPTEQKKTLKSNIASFEAYLNCRHPKN